MKNTSIAQLSPCIEKVMMRLFWKLCKMVLTWCGAFDVLALKDPFTAVNQQRNRLLKPSLHECASELNLIY